jgi:hypothetical protein
MYDRFNSIMKSTAQVASTSRVVGGIIPGVVHALTRPSTYALVTQRLSKTFNNNRPDVKRAAQTLKNLANWWSKKPAAPPSSSDDSDTPRQQQARGMLARMVGEARFQLRTMEAGKRFMHAVRSYAQYMAGMTPQEHGANDAAEYYETYEYHRLNRQRQLVSSTSQSQQGYFTIAEHPKDRNKKQQQKLSGSIFVDTSSTSSYGCYQWLGVLVRPSCLPPFEGYAPWQNNVLDPFSLADMFT